MAPHGTQGWERRVRSRYEFYRASMLVTSMRRAAARDLRSGLLLVVDVPDDIGDVLVSLLLLLDEGRVVHALVLDLDVVLGPLDRLALAGLLALGFGVRFLERNELGLGRLRH